MCAAFAINGIGTGYHHLRHAVVYGIKGIVYLGYHTTVHGAVGKQPLVACLVYCGDEVVGIVGLRITPGNSKQYVSVTSYSFASPLAVSAAIVSALVLSRLPLPSCVRVPQWAQCLAL